MHKSEIDVIRHVVIIEVAERDDEELDRLLALLEELPGKIEEIRGFSCGRTERGNSSASLVVDFDDWDAFEKYRNHVEHQQVLDLLRRISTAIYVSDHEPSPSSVPHGHGLQHPESRE